MHSGFTAVSCSRQDSEAFLQLGFQFLIRLGPFLDSRPVSGHGVTFLRGNDPSRRQARRAKSNRSVKNASQVLRSFFLAAGKSTLFKISR